jgi:ribose-phosphate pyrophosphokinase
MQIDTAGTLCTAATNLKHNGATRVFAFASHGLFSGPASDRIARSDLEEVVVTNTIPLRAGAKTNERIVQLSVAALLAEAIKRVHHKQSVSEIFKDAKKQRPAASAKP